MNTATISEKQAFIAAIRANYDDDLPRMVYADWLQEHDEPERAEFIRVQCCNGTAADFAITTGDSYGDDFHEGPRYPLFWGKAPEPESLGSLAARFRDWPILSRAGEHIRYSRGFIHHISCTAEAWIRHADAILAEHPVRTVNLTSVPEVQITVYDYGDVTTREVEYEILGVGKSIHVGLTYRTWANESSRQPQLTANGIIDLILQPRWGKLGVSFTMPEVPRLPAPVIGSTLRLIPPRI